MQRREYKLEIDPAFKLLVQPLEPSSRKLLEDNIHQAGKEEAWVRRSLLRQGYKDEADVLLALWDGGEKLMVFPMHPEKK